MNIMFKFLYIVIAVFSINISMADETKLYEVTITNLSRGQIISPVFAFTHNGSESLFTHGEPASPELAALAQDADSNGLMSLFSASSATHEIVLGTAVIKPGNSETLTIHSNHDMKYISLAAMLVSSNDAFIAINKLKLPSRSMMVTIPAYDAGSEVNDENCDYIPGPPCGNANKASDKKPEGFVHIHSGIHGIADLDPTEYDWRNPVAKISIRRVKDDD
ncbi:MAG: spondin domain-containing protein [Methylococcaceae bacterium]|nr:spondin domain-containing protein [Methylococcaceae bacterium]